MLYVNIVQVLEGTMFGLSDITIIAVGGVVLVITAALVYWGLTFEGHD